MKLDNRYEIRVVLIERRYKMPCGDKYIYGDVYDSLSAFKEDHPDCDYDIGYVVFDTEVGGTPAECNDWNDSIDEAIVDWQENCVDPHHGHDQTHHAVGVKIQRFYKMYIVDEKGEMTDEQIKEEARKRILENLDSVFGVIDEDVEMPIEEGDILDIWYMYSF